MADEQNPNNQGTPPQQAQPQQAPPQAQQPQAQSQPQSPRPPANAQEVIAAQQAALAEQIAMAQQRDRAQFGPAAPGTQAPAPVLGGVFAQASQAQQQQAPQQQAPQQQPPPPQGFNLPQGQTAQQVAQGIPHSAPQPQPQQYAPGLAGIPNPAFPQQGGMQQPDFSKLPDPSIPQNGVTVQQLAAQSQIQGGPPPQYQYQQQQSQQQQQSDRKPTVLWHPARNSKLVIELEDSFVGGLPESIEQETNPQAKVVAVLLSEILSLRARVAQLEQGGGAQAQDPELASRVYRLEATLFEQTQALQQGARAFREEVERKEMLSQQGAQGAQTGEPVSSGGTDPGPTPESD